MKLVRTYIAGLVLLTTLGIPGAYVHALGLSVTPAEMSISQTQNDTTATMTVKNVSNDVALFEVYPDEFDQSISVSPASFTLQSGEVRTVTVHVHFDQSGIYTTNISVTARPLAETALAAAGGIKMPLTVSVNGTSLGTLASVFGTGTSVPPVLILLALALAFLLAVNYCYRMLVKRWL